MKSAAVLLLWIFALSSNPFATRADQNPSRSPASICDPMSQDQLEWDQSGEGDLDAYFTQRGIVQITPGIERKYLVQVALELLKFPEELLVRIFKANGRINLIQGQGVSEDPSWIKDYATFDGRLWSYVPGAGGAPYASIPGRMLPTRIVVNRLYEGHGSVNLLLHEHAHAMDSISAHEGISRSSAWRELVKNNPGFREFLQDHCHKYCVDNFNEGFAEAFAYYNGCVASRKKLEEKAPQVAQFFRELPGKNIQDIR